MARVAKVKEVFAGHFECRYCELDVPATVRAVGWGGERPLPMSSTQSIEEEALEDAGGVASRTLQFVKCPRCGKYDPTGKSYRIQVALGVVVIGAIVFGLAYLYLKARASETELDRTEQLWASGLLGVLISAVLYWKWGRPWRGAEKRTRIHFRRD